MSLPTFEQAMAGFSIAGLTAGEALKTRRLQWTWSKGAALLGPYLDGNDLAACCLASKEFNDVFSPILWTDPIVILKDKKKPYCMPSTSFCAALLANYEQTNFTSSCTWLTVPEAECDPWLKHWTSIR